MDVDARNKKLADTVEKSGKVCPKGMKTYFQGFDLALRHIGMFGVDVEIISTVPRKMKEGIGIVNCDVVKKVGYPLKKRPTYLLITR